MLLDWVDFSPRHPTWYQIYFINVFSDPAQVNENTIKFEGLEWMGVEWKGRWGE